MGEQWVALNGVKRLGMMGVRPDHALHAAPLLQERAYVTGLTAANLVIDQLGVGQPANILPGLKSRVESYLHEAHLAGAV